MSGALRAERHLGHSFLSYEHKYLRDRVLLDLAIASKLRGCDFVKIKIGDVLSRIDYMGHLSARQYARYVNEWVSEIGLNYREYGTHSMRRTNVSLIYQATGNLRGMEILLGHTNIENTVGYWT